MRWHVDVPVHKSRENLKLFPDLDEQFLPVVRATALKDDLTHFQDHVLKNFRVSADLERTNRVQFFLS